MHLRWETRTCGCSFIVMEDDHDEVPVSVTQVPEDPVNGVWAEDDGQHTQIHDNHDWAGQRDHQRHKHLQQQTESSDQKRWTLRAAQLWTLLRSDVIPPTTPNQRVILSTSQ